jgi:hypothetical protein
MGEYLKGQTPNYVAQSALDQVSRANTTAATATQTQQVVIQQSGVSSAQLAAVQSAITTLQTALTALQAQVAGMETVVESVEADADILAGQAVCINTSGHAIPAQANSSLTSDVVGIALASVSAGFSVSYTAAGAITLPDWTAIVGSSTLLPGATYYLSPGSAGCLTTTAPTESGQCVVSVGDAMSSDTLSLLIMRKILL